MQNLSELRQGNAKDNKRRGANKSCLYGRTEKELSKVLWLEKHLDPTPSATERSNTLEPVGLFT